MEDNQKKSGGGFLKFLGICFLILILIGGIVFIAKCAIKKQAESTGESINTDGNPILLNRAATNTDFDLTENIKASIFNLKETYTLTPNVDIKNLEITFKYYDSSHKLIDTKVKSIGNVIKSSDYSVSIEHSLSQIFSIDTFSYTTTGGTVSYFSK